jgi:hypothetical protein
MPEPTVAEVHDADLQSVVDEALSRRPDPERGVVVLGDLAGMTRKEAARPLGIPEGSVASRLARARAMLAKRLTQRGVVFSGGIARLIKQLGDAAFAKREAASKERETIGPPALAAVRNAAAASADAEIRPRAERLVKRITEAAALAELAKLWVGDVRPPEDVSPTRRAGSPAMLVSSNALERRAG